MNSKISIDHTEDMGIWAVAKKSASTNIYRYPEFIAGGDSETGNDQEIAKECIKFTVMKQGGVSIKSGAAAKFREDAIKSGSSRAKTRKTTLENNFNGLSSAEVLERGSAFQEDINKTQEVIGRLQNKLIDDLDIFDGISATGSFLDSQTKNINQKEEILESAFLYMPPSIVFNEGASWGKQALGAAGNAVAQAVKGGKITDILKEFGVGIAPEVAMATALGASAKIGGILAAAGLGALGQGIPGAIGQTARIAQNPYEEQLFQGIDFRVFSFQFEFNPVSQTEYTAVENIIKMFRKNSKPTFTIQGDSQALYSYPNEFKIEFLHLDTSGDTYDINKSLPMIYNCVLTNITTNYAPSEWRAHQGGEPTSIMIQLAFTETVKITQKDIEGGY